MIDGSEDEKTKKFIEAKAFVFLDERFVNC